MFVWTEPKRAKHVVDQQAQARDAMYRQELEHRAGLLHRLGRSPAYIKARLASNVAWDFDLAAKPPHAADVDKIVDAVIRRQSAK